jgi:hypothetical protein
MVEDRKRQRLQHESGSAAGNVTQEAQPTMKRTMHTRMAVMLRLKRILLAMTLKMTLKRKKRIKLKIMVTMRKHRKSNSKEKKDLQE